MSLEEADEILLLSLRRSKIPVPAAFKALKDTTPEILIKLVVNAVRAIRASVLPSDFSDALPAHMTTRHRMATALSSAIKEVGYPGDMGFNQLLYPNEKDTRRLLSWLVSKVPRVEDDSGKTASSTPGLSAVLYRNLKNWVKSSSSASVPSVPVRDMRSLEVLAPFLPSSPPPSAPSSSRIASGLRIAATVSRATYATGATGMDGAAAALSAVAAGALLSAPASVSVSASAGDSTVSAANLSTTLSVLHTSVAVHTLLHAQAGDPSHSAQWDSLRGGRGAGPCFPGTHLDAFPSVFNRIATFAVPPAHYTGISPFAGGSGAATDAAKTEEELAAEREAEVAALGGQLDALNDSIQRLAEQHRLLLTTIPALKAQLQAANEQREVLERRFVVRKACLDMLPDAVANIERLTAEVAASTDRLLALAEQWETHRLPLVNAIHEALASNAINSAAADKVQAAILEIRSNMNELAASMASKEEQAAKMAAEWARLKEAIPGLGDGAGASADGDVATRPGYTKRIMDIIRQIRKQKAEIGKIVKDVRNVQQEINDVSDKLQRTTAIASDMMEKAAAEHTKDAAYRQVLRHLITLQEVFQQLVSATSALGHTENEIRQLENRIDQMSARNDARNMDQLMRDLEQIRAENAALESGVVA